MEPDVTLELYVRSLAPRGDGGRLDDHLADLCRLAAAGVADHEVRVWGDAVPVGGPAADTAPAAEALDAVETFAAWADREGAEFPASSATRGTLADGSRSVVEVPGMALAEYRDGELARVTPVVREDRVETVADHVASLRPRSGRDAVAGDADTRAAADGERQGDELFVEPS